MIRSILLLGTLIVASCTQYTKPINMATDSFLDGDEIRALLVGSCMTGKLADGRPYQRSWTEDKIEETHTGHSSQIKWYYYHGKWSVNEAGLYERIIIPHTRYYMIARNDDTIVWVEVDKDGNRLGATHYGVLGDGCYRL